MGSSLLSGLPQLGWLCECHKSGALVILHWVVPLVLLPLLLYQALACGLSEQGSEPLRKQQPRALRVQKQKLPGILKAELQNPHSLPSAACCLLVEASPWVQPKGRGLHRAQILGGEVHPELPK